MATQHDYDIANGTGQAVRQDINSVLQAIVSNNSGTSEPATTFKYQWWADETTNTLKLRNSSNNAWITLRELDGTMLIEDGSASSPGLAFADDTNTGIFSDAADRIGFATGGVERFRIETGEVIVNEPSNDVNFRVESNGNTHMLFVDAGSDRVGIGTSSPGRQLQINGDSDTQIRVVASSGGTAGIQFGDADDSVMGGVSFDGSDDSLQFLGFNNSEAARIDSSGRLLIGTTASTSLGTDSYKAQIKASGASAGLGIIRTADSVAPPFFSLAKSRNDGIVQSGDGLGKIQWIAHDGNDYNNVSVLINAEVDSTPGGDDVPGRLMFHTTANGASSPTERARITSDGNFLIGTTEQFSGASSTATGHRFEPSGVVQHYRNSGASLYVGRQGNDGLIVSIRQAGNEEGTITVSGSTVSYNGGHLSRWSQLAGGVERTEILRGSVLSNLDEMCEWGEEDNEQLNRMKVSDVEGDVNVAGVFQAWDDDDDTYINDFYCAMTGDFIIRIAQGTTVARGDLLMSAGDGTAKPQDDDIVRSKTIAKVTSTTVSTTYSDGSYCVPCVLMAC